MKVIMPILLKWKVEGNNAKYTLNPIQKNDVQNQIQYVKLSNEMTSRPHHFISWGKVQHRWKHLQKFVKSQRTKNMQMQVESQIRNWIVMSS
mmetsp:Transcript_34587/g.87463  ORF Transcript_34587/g.87463 Transcript_34587/m.87463 type:complete len:92 (+) Transcript_34587:815-1090(+)